MSLTPRIDDIQPNLIINGAFDFWQRFEGATRNLLSGTAYETADRILSTVQGSTSKEISLGQSTDVPSPLQAGFGAQFSILTGVVIATASFGNAADLVAPYIYRVEGFDYAAIHGQQVTVSFWFKASVAGTYTLALNGADFARSYTTTFSIPTPSVWTYIQATVVLDTAAGYIFNQHHVGLEISIGGLAGTQYTTSTLNQWQNGNIYTATGVTNWMASTSNTIQVAMLSLTKGPNGLPQGFFHRIGRNISDELSMCQRYFEKSYDIGIAPATAAANGSFRIYGQNQVSSTFSPRGSCVFKVTKRVAPSMALYDASTGSNTTFTNELSGYGQTIVVDSAGSQSFTARGSNFEDAQGYYLVQFIADAEL